MTRCVFFRVRLEQTNLVVMVMMAGGLWLEQGISDSATSSWADEQRGTDRFGSVWLESELQRQGIASKNLAQNLRSFEGQTQCHLPVLLSSGEFEPIRSPAGFLIGTVLMFFSLFFSEFHNWFKQITQILFFCLLFFYMVLIFPPYVKRWKHTAFPLHCSSLQK